MAKYSTMLKSLVLLAGLAAAQIPPYQKPGPGDLRGPCPGLNTLANHNLLPHSGKNITQEDLVRAMRQGVSQDESISMLLFRMAAITNPSNDTRSFSLPDLGRHGILEHDASLSRVDAYFGDPNPFNQTIFDQTLAAWPDDTINITTSAAARAIQVRQSQATNPKYNMSGIAQSFTTGESIAYILVFGDIVTGVTPKDDVVYWFENEQFPPGYTPPANVVNYTNLQTLSAQLEEALIEQGVDLGGPSTAPAPAAAARSIHFPVPLK